MTEPPVLPCNISNSWVIPRIQAWVVVIGLILTLGGGVWAIATGVERYNTFVTNTNAIEVTTAAKLTELSVAINRLNYNYCMADGHHQCDSNGVPK